MCEKCVTDFASEKLSRWWSNQTWMLCEKVQSLKTASNIFQKKISCTSFGHIEVLHASLFAEFSFGNKQLVAMLCCFGGCIDAEWGVHERRTTVGRCRIFTLRQPPGAASNVEKQHQDELLYCLRINIHIHASFHAYKHSLHRYRAYKHIFKRMDVMLMRKINIKSDYAARGPSLTGLAIILKSNVLLLFPPHLASLELFRIIC